MTQNTRLHEELSDLLLEIGKAQTDIVRLRGRIADINERIRNLVYPTLATYDGFDSTHEIKCEHHVPLGDFCELCTREVRRHRCDIHDTNVIGACPYCAETHRLDTPEG
jgi:hypothetical protein